MKGNGFNVSELFLSVLVEGNQINDPEPLGVMVGKLSLPLVLLPDADIKPQHSPRPLLPLSAPPNQHGLSIPPQSIDATHIVYSHPHIILTLLLFPPPTSFHALLAVAIPAVYAPNNPIRQTPHPLHVHTTFLFSSFGPSISSVSILREKETDR